MDLLRFILQRFFDVNALDFMNIGAERAFTQAQLKLNFIMLHLLIFGLALKRELVCCTFTKAIFCCFTAEVYSADGQLIRLSQSRQ